MTADYRVLVTASRDLKDRLLVRQLLDDCLTIALYEEYERLVVVHGACPTGGDAFADEWAVEMKNAGMPVDYERHPAQGHPTQDFGPWPGCGPRRNGYMVSLGAHECLALIGPCTSTRCRRIDPHGSHGASGCAAAALRAGIKVDKWDLWKAS
jgi:hypothetical protein